VKARLFVLALAGASCAFAQYGYDWSSSPLPDYPDPAHWTTNCCYDGFEITNNQGGNIGFGLFGSGSFYYVPTVSGVNPNDYEVSSVIYQAPPTGGAYTHYLRGGSVTVSITGQQVAIQEGGSQLAATTLGGNLYLSTMRSVIWGTNLWVFINNHLVLSTSQLTLTYGQPGIGGAGNDLYQQDVGFTNIQIGHHDTVAPYAVVQTGIRPSILPNSVSLQWQGVSDDPSGVGVYGYTVSRSDISNPNINNPMGFSLGAEFEDFSVSPSTTYTYSISAVDYHGNTSTATTFTVTTPPAGAVDPRRVGDYVTGSYWGGGGEQIDTLSGNLNYSQPLVSPMGRPGWTVPLGLTYNSQNWRQDNGTNWQLGTDVGYGFGWKMQIGSITPYYAGYGNGIHHYVFTDGTGAEYRLDQNTCNAMPCPAGIWSSTQGIYVWFDANANVLHFKNGTFWTMGSVSGGAEQDAGTMYPTVIEDSSGNYIVVNYQPSPTVPFSTSNSSARVSTIVDSRAVYYNYCNCVATYYFDYATASGDTIPHLHDIGNYIGLVAETYSGFSYGSAPVAVEPAFGDDASYSGVTTRQLDSITVPVAGSYSFLYDTGSGSVAGASELTQVTFPWGGHLGWNYIDAHYAGSRLLREVGTRYLAADAAGSNVWSYPFSHSDSGGTIQTVHADTTLADASGNGAKKWTFVTGTTNPWQVGLTSTFTQSATAGGTTLTQDTYTWAQGPAPTGQPGNPYIAQKTSVHDGITAQSATTAQTLDMYGNVTQSIVYPYNNSTTALQTYNSTYLNTSSYISAYIRDRLNLSTLTSASGTNNLIQNYYDQMSGYSVYSALGCPNGYSSGNFGMWAGWPNGPYGSGLVTAAVTPARSTCSYYLGGVAESMLRSDGPGTSVTLSASTGYTAAAPSTISAGSESVSLSYNSWLGITQTTGSNGEQMYMTYDSYGRPSTGTSPYGTYGTPTVTYGYSAAGVTPVWQTQVGPNGFTRTTLDGLGRTVKVERGPSSSNIQSVVTTVYAPCACSPLAKIQSVSQPYAPGGTVYSTVYTYDGIGRTLSVRQAGRGEHYDYFVPGQSDDGDRSGGEVEAVHDRRFGESGDSDGAGPVCHRQHADHQLRV